MKVQINTDNHTDGTGGRSAGIEAFVEERLGRYASRLTRVEVHLSDANSQVRAGGNDKECRIEVRPNGLQPMTVRDQGDTHDQAMRGAINKMKNMLDSTLGKLETR